MAEQFAASKGITSRRPTWPRPSPTSSPPSTGRSVPQVQQAQSPGAPLVLPVRQRGRPSPATSCSAGLPGDGGRGPDPQPGGGREAAGPGGRPLQPAVGRLLQRQPAAVHRGVRERHRHRHPGPRQPAGRPDQRRCVLRRRGQGQLARLPDRRPTAGRWAATTPRPRSNRPCRCRRSTVGQPIAPVQDPTTGEWVIYEVTSQTGRPAVGGELGGPPGAAAGHGQREPGEPGDRGLRPAPPTCRSTPSTGPGSGSPSSRRSAPPSRYLLGAASGQTPLVARRQRSADRSDGG